jgi:hypothetical protein
MKSVASFGKNKVRTECEKFRAVDRHRCQIKQKEAKGNEGFFQPSSAIIFVCFAIFCLESSSSMVPE